LNRCSALVFLGGCAPAIPTTNERFFGFGIIWCVVNGQWWVVSGRHHQKSTDDFKPPKGGAQGFGSYEKQSGAYDVEDDGACDPDGEHL